MGTITVSTAPVLSAFFAPLQELLARLAPNACGNAAEASPPSISGTRPAQTVEVNVERRLGNKNKRACNDPVFHQHSTVAAPSRLRIVRAFEPGVSTACAGRMVISGRMADVCAELDRLTRQQERLVKAIG